MSGNYLSSGGWRRVSALMLALIVVTGCLGLSPITGDFAFAATGFDSESTSSTETALDKAVDYYKTGQQGRLLDFWELMAIHGACEDLTDYVLPDTKAINDNSMPSDYADAFITQLVKGYLPDKALATQLVAKQSATTGSFGYEMSNQQAWAMIALDLYNRNVLNPEDKVSYNTEKAIDYLMSFQTEGNFYYSSQYPYPGVDYTGAAAVALAPYLGTALWPETLEREALIAGLKYDKVTHGSYGNAGAAAFAIFGYNALGISRESEDYQAALAELIGYQVADGGFYSPWADRTKSDPYYTKQATAALAEAVAGASLFLSLEKNPVRYISVSVMVQGPDGMAFSTLTTGGDAVISQIVAKAAAEGTDLTGYNYYIDGSKLDPERINETTMEDGQQLLALPGSVTHLASLSANKEEVTIGEEVTLSLSVVSLESGEIAVVATGTKLTINGIEVYTVEENLPFVHTFTPVEAGSYTFEILWPEGTTDCSAASFTLTAGELDQAVPVSIRVEGIDGNILYNSAFTVTGSQSLLTVFDAITQVLEHSAVPFETRGVEILSIDNVANDTTFATSRYWMYTLNKEQYLDGSDWVLPTTLISENDEIIVYCGSTATYPFVESLLQGNGDVKLTFTSYQYDSSWNLALRPIEGAALSWASGTDRAFVTTTDENGQAVVPAANAGEGSYTLQIYKSGGDGIPSIIRLAPGYEIRITAEGAGGNVPSTPGDNVPKVSIRVIGPDNETFFSKTSYTHYEGMTALDLLRRTGLSIGYSDSSKRYVSSIQGVHEFDDGPASGWLFKVNSDESILSSAASYELEAGDALVWFYTKDYTKESGSSKWSGTQVVEQTGSIAKEELNAVLKEMKAGSRDSWTVGLALGNISFDKDALVGLVDQLAGDSLEITIEQASGKNLSVKQREAVGDCPVYDIKISTGKKNISQFGGKLTISLPYTLKDGERPSGIVVYHLDAEGNLVRMEGVYDPVAGKVVFTVDHLSFFVIGYDETLAQWPFADVAEDDSIHWFYNPVKFVYEHGIFSGTGAKTFSPNSPLTRSMLVSVLARMSGADLTAYKAVPFGDVDINSWYGPSVAWAKEAGIVSGYANKDGSFHFKPDDKISRQDIAVMLKNYNDKVAKNEYVHKASELTFTDHPQIAEYARAAVKSMQQEGILNGIKNADGSFRFQPLKNATRAEAATMMYNMLKTKEKQ